MASRSVNVVFTVASRRLREISVSSRRLKEIRKAYKDILLQKSDKNMLTNK